MYLNLHTVQTRTENDRSDTSIVTKTQMLFHSQFVLSIDRYRDNNNFIRHNNLQYTNDRWSLAPYSYHAEYLDFEEYPVFESGNMVYSRNTTRDGGLTWSNE